MHSDDMRIKKQKKKLRNKEFLKKYSVGICTGLVFLFCCGLDLMFAKLSPNTVRQILKPIFAITFPFAYYRNLRKDIIIEDILMEKNKYCETMCNYYKDGVCQYYGIEIDETNNDGCNHISPKEN